jgi:alkylation response protein AidB-like acyl-CoA dehydrogenase
MPPVSTSLLADLLLEGCRGRAAGYDRDNRFCQEDFDELKAAGYLKMALPKEFGGYGLTLAEAGRETRRLATYAPATALCINMHHYWVGTAADTWRTGDKSVEWMLQDAAAGEVFAAGHAESGNETSLFSSTTKAERVDGGYTMTGRKSFGSLTPVWTRLGLHGMDTSDAANPRIIHGFVERSTKGISTKDTWDVMGMRATRSDDTILDGAFVPDKYVARVNPAGLAGADAFVLGVFAWAQCTFGSMYLAIARRALDLTAADLEKKTSIALDRPSMAWYPPNQWMVSEMYIDLEGATAHVERMAQDWSDGVDHGGMWPAKFVSAKYHAVEATKRIVDRAMDLSGGAGMFKGNELERLYRDARCGGFHPANSGLVHELVGKSVLGLLGAEPRF